MNNGMYLTSYSITEPDETFYLYYPGWLNAWESHLYNQALKSTSKSGWGFKRFGTTKDIYAREMVRKPDYINYIEALEQASDRALQEMPTKERMLLLKSRTAFIYVDAWGESAVFENITSALHTSTIDTLPKNLLKKFSVKEVSCKMRGEKMSLLEAMQWAQDYLQWDVFDYVVICAAYRAIPTLVFSDEDFSAEVQNKKPAHKGGINLTVERTGCFIFSRRPGEFKVRCGHYLIPQNGVHAYGDIFLNAPNIELFSDAGEAYKRHPIDPEFAARTINLADIFGASGFLTPALSWEYLKQQPLSAAAMRTIVPDNFGGCSYFDTWYETGEKLV
ncbi:ATP-binding protein [Kosakonia sp. BYX6]|uniref:ATP-binding protein n=1 Tax=Kosakonia calanthes TaxID=3139408 RepID=A0ABZ3B0H1_9ENTR